MAIKTGRKTPSKGKRMPGVKRLVKPKLKKTKSNGIKLRLAAMQDRCTNINNLNNVSKMMKIVGSTAEGVALSARHVIKYLDEIKDKKNQSKKLIVRKGNAYYLQENKNKRKNKKKNKKKTKNKKENTTKKGSTSTTAKRKRKAVAAKTKPKANPKTKLILSL